MDRVIWKRLIFTYASIALLTWLYCKLAISSIGTGGGIYIAYEALFTIHLVYILVDLLWIWIARIASDALWMFFNLSKRYSIPILEFIICIFYVFLRPSLFSEHEWEILSYLPVVIPKLGILLFSLLRKDNQEVWVHHEH